MDRRGERMMHLKVAAIKAPIMAITLNLLNVVDWNSSSTKRTTVLIFGKPCI